MKFGDCQNLISVIIGLNVAYTAFRELRIPYITAFKADVDGLVSDTHESGFDTLPSGEFYSAHAPAYRALWSKAFDLQNELNLYIRETNNLASEEMYGTVSMVVAGLGMAALVLSTMYYDRDTIALDLLAQSTHRLNACRRASLHQLQHHAHRAKEVR